MTYNPYEWTNGELITDVKLNHIEDGIGSNSEDIEALRGAYGTPLVASSAADMTDTNKIYVYVGNESGYTNGHWYYYNGTDWADGGAYNATALVTDTTLSVAGKAADAKATGDAVNNLKSALASALPTASASGAVASFTDGADNVPVEDLKISIEPKQSGSGDPSPDNVRPISGWTAANVVRTGKNLIDDSIKTVQSASTCVIGQTSTSEFNVYLPAGTYTISFGSSKAPDIYYRLSTESSGAHNVITYGNKTGTFTLTENAHLRIWAYLSAGIAPADIEWFQIESGSTATEYEPYTAQTYPISFGSAGTVYGGTLDVTTGVLTVDRAMFNAKDKTWRWGGYTYVYTPITDTILTERTQVVCSHLGFMGGTGTLDGHCSWGGNPNNGNLCARSSAIAPTLADWNTYIASHDVQFVYYLATPQTYQLTPTEVRTLLENNNIWADTGDSTVEYKADTTRYIDRRINTQQKLISGVETSYTATKNYAIGDYVIVNDSLYKVTAAIATGATITPGTNCVATTVAEQLILLANA